MSIEHGNHFHVRLQQNNQVAQAMGAKFLGSRRALKPQR